MSVYSGFSHLAVFYIDSENSSKNSNKEVINHKCSKHYFYVESRAISSLLFRRLAEKQSVISLKSLQMAVFDLTTTHRLLLRQPADRNDGVSNTQGYKLQRKASEVGYLAELEG
jgi:hypothetical protein